MPVDWNEIQSILPPVKDYEDLARRWQEAYAYAFVREAYTFSIPQMSAYTRLLLGGDTRGRYGEYEAALLKTFERLERAGVGDIASLTAQVNTRDQLESFVDLSGVPVKDLILLFKYLVYWVIPGKKYLGGLARDETTFRTALEALRGVGIRYNLDILERGLTPRRRKALAEASRLPESVITELVHRADFSRLPWASKATISNIIGAGYESLAKLANADPAQLTEDFFRYGTAIGKNLKLGNEIESSHRIAKILPVVLRED